MPGAEAQELRAKAGADVDSDTGLVHIPSRLGEDALAAAPRDVLLAGRDTVRDVHCDGDVHLTLDGTGSYERIAAPIAAAGRELTGR